MNKDLLLKYIQGNSTADEADRVMAWVGQDERHEQYLVRLMNLWVSQNVPQDKASEEELADMYEAIERNARGKKPKRGFHIRRAAAWTAAACLVLAAALVFRAAMFDKQADSLAGFARGEYGGARLFYTDKGIKGCVTLPDSSRVWLNSDSKLWYPDNFGADRREVAISGEGYFEVKHDPDRPMVVTTTKDLRVEVLGTVFNIKSYENDDNAVATLYSGSINIITNAPSGRPQTRALLPNESITIYDNEHAPVTATGCSDENSAWMEGRIHLRSTTVAEAIKILERWYGVEFIVDDGSRDILNYQITADFRNESIVDIMDLVRRTSFIDYDIDGEKVFLRKR
jgi:ferric-dicitrate binding protein FerR (iron transport regulator)